MLLNWLRQRRWRKILAQPWPREWDDIIRANVRHVQILSAEQQRQVLQLTQIFVAEKYWEGCDGFVITDEVKVTVAAQACLLLLPLANECYNNVLSILVYPGEQTVVDSDTSHDGIVTEQSQLRLGEAVWRGPVILSWPDVLAGGRGESSGSNLTLHEFAHQVDMMNGRFADGIPPLNSLDELQGWQRVMQPAYQQHVTACESGRRGVIDCYGAVNEAEFFAVMVEAFFERPVPLQQENPDIYDLLKSYFQLDPTATGR